MFSSVHPCITTYRFATLQLPSVCRMSVQPVRNDDDDDDGVVKDVIVAAAASPLILNTNLR